MFSDSIGSYKHRYCSQSSSKSSSSDDSMSLSEWIEISKNLLSDDESSESEINEDFSLESFTRVQKGEPEKVLSTLSTAQSTASTKIARKKVFECLICGKILKKNLRRHIESVHYKIKNWYCNFCLYPFYYKHDLKRHLLSHMTNPNFVPRKRIRIESAKKSSSFVCSWIPYKPNVRHKFFCNIGSCVRRFATSSQLKNHVNITHSGESDEISWHSNILVFFLDSRPHQCWCLKSFKAKSSLLRHHNEKHVHAKFFAKYWKVFLLNSIKIKNVMRLI